MSAKRGIVIRSALDRPAARVGLLLGLIVSIPGTAFGAGDSCTLHLSARGPGGPSLGVVRLEKQATTGVSDDAALTWAAAQSIRLTNGGERSTDVEPGSYRVRLQVGRTLGLPRTVTLQSGQHWRYRFDVGRIRVVARSLHSPGRGEVFLEQQRRDGDPGTEPPRWEYVGAFGLRKGSRDIDVVPGTYRLKFCPGGVWSEPEQVCVGGPEIKSLFFALSTVGIEVRGAEGATAETVVNIESLRPATDGKPAEWARVRALRCQRGSGLAVFLPGRYRARLKTAESAIVSDSFTLAFLGGVRLSIDTESGRCTIEQTDLDGVTCEDVAWLFAGGPGARARCGVDLSDVGGVERLLERVRHALRESHGMNQDAVEKELSGAKVDGGEAELALQRAAVRYVVAADETAARSRLAELRRCMKVVLQRHSTKKGARD